MTRKIKFSGTDRVIALLLIAFLPLGQMAGGTATQPDELGFEIIKTHTGDVETIGAADIDNDGNTDIIYAGLFNTDLHIIYGKPGGSFETPISYPVWMGTMTFDFIDGDSLLDIITAGGYEMYILLNNGDRSFAIDSVPRKNVILGSVVTAFINSDSYLDIVAADGFIYYGDGTGKFPSVDTLGFTFQTVYINDFNNDGIDDLVVSDDYGTTSIYLNDGDGNFSEKSVISLGCLTLAFSTNEPSVDFNRDGNADFAFIAPQIGSAQPHPFQSRITVAYGDGSGGISDSTYLWVNGTAYSLAITDVNRDNNLDLVASDASHSQLVIFTGDGAGLFSEQLKIEYMTDSTMHAMATGDIDRDGNPDFVAGAFWSDSITIALNTLEDDEILPNAMITTGYSNVCISIQNPGGYELSRNYKTVAGSAYWRQDIDQDNVIDEWAIDYNLQYGEYKIIIKPKPNTSPGAKFSAKINIGESELILFKDYEAPPQTAKKSGGFDSDSIIFHYTVEPVSSVQPPSGTSSHTDLPTFDWHGLVADLPPSDAYDFQLDRYYDFRSPIFDYMRLPTPQFTPPYPLGSDSVFYWRVRWFDGAGWTDFTNPYAVYIVAKPTDADDNSRDGILPDAYSLNQNYPNPFNPGTSIEFTIPRRSHVELVVYNILGQKAATLIDKNMPAGKYTAYWDGTDHSGKPSAAGIYFYRMDGGDFVAARKMILLK